MPNTAHDNNEREGDIFFADKNQYNHVKSSKKNARSQSRPALPYNKEVKTPDYTITADDPEPKNNGSDILAPKDILAALIVLLKTSVSQHDIGMWTIKIMFCSDSVSRANLRRTMLKSTSSPPLIPKLSACFPKLASPLTEDGLFELDKVAMLLVEWICKTPRKLSANDTWIVHIWRDNRKWKITTICGIGICTEYG